MGSADTQSSGLTFTIAPSQEKTAMTTHDLLMLALMLSPGILLSVLVMASFAAGG